MASFTRMEGKSGRERKKGSRGDRKGLHSCYHNYQAVRAWPEREKTLIVRSGCVKLRKRKEGLRGGGDEKDANATRRSSVKGSEKKGAGLKGILGLGQYACGRREKRTANTL